MSVLTVDDLKELTEATTALGVGYQAVLDLADRMKRKGDHDRADALRVRAAWLVQRALENVEALFT